MRFLDQRRAEFTLPIVSSFTPPRHIKKRAKKAEYKKDLPYMGLLLYYDGENSTTALLSSLLLRCINIGVEDHTAYSTVPILPTRRLRCDHNPRANASLAGAQTHTLQPSPRTY